MSKVTSLDSEVGKTGVVQLTKSKEVNIIKFLIHLSTRIPSCLGLPYHYITVLLPAYSIGTHYFAYNLESFLTRLSTSN